MTRTRTANTSDTPTRAHASKRRKRPEDWERLLSALEEGATRRCACGVACVHPSTFYGRLALDEDFATEVRRREGLAELVCSDTLWQAAKNGDVQAAMWWLERRRPEEWGPHSAIAMLQRIVREVQRMSDAELAVALAQMRANGTLREDPAPAGERG